MLEDSTGKNLRADCQNCFGLCCVALYFSAAEGFPTDKAPGQPCPNLQGDFRCRVHQKLWAKGLKGCTAFDCFGAGPKVAQHTFAGLDWRQAPESAQQMFAVFLCVRQLQEMLWYLAEALNRQPAQIIYPELLSLYEETEVLTRLSAEELLKLELPAHRERVNVLLLKTGELVRAAARRGQTAPGKLEKRLKRGADLIGADLRKAKLLGANLRGALLIAADLRGTDLSGTELIGADFRDADLRGADLSQSLFLTQAQINTAKGDASAMLPPSLTYPAHWEGI